MCGLTWMVPKQQETKEDILSTQGWFAVRKFRKSHLKKPNSGGKIIRVISNICLASRAKFSINHFYKIQVDWLTYFNILLFHYLFNSDLDISSPVLIRKNNNRFEIEMLSYWFICCFVEAHKFHIIFRIKVILFQNWKIFSLFEKCKSFTKGWSFLLMRTGLLVKSKPKIMRISIGTFF